MKRSACLAIAVAALFGGASAAQAQDYAPADAASFQSDLDAAALSPEADTITLGAHAYANTNPTGFTYSGASDLTITGAGRSDTTITPGATAAPSALDVGGTGKITVQDVGFAATGAGQKLLVMGGGPGSVVQRVNIDATGTDWGGLDLVGAGTTVTDASIVASATAAGIFVDGNGQLDNSFTISDTQISGGAWGVDVNYPGRLDLELAGLRISNAQVGLRVGDLFQDHWQTDPDDAVKLHDSLFELRNPNDTAIFVDTVATNATDPTHILQHEAIDHLSAARLTIVGSGASGQKAVNIHSDNTDDVRVDVADTLVRSVATPLVTQQDQVADDDGFVELVTSHSSIPNTCGNTGAGTTVENLPLAPTADPQFADPAAGDYSLLSTSPFIDQGATDPSGTDLAGHTRTVGGHSDLGAYEYGTAVNPTPDPITPDGPLDCSTPPPTDNGGGGTTNTGGTTTTGGTTAPTTTASAASTSLVPSLGGVKVTVKKKSSTPKVTKATAAAVSSKKGTNLTLVTFTLSKAGKVKLTLQRKVGKKWTTLKGSVTVNGKKGKHAYSLKNKKLFSHLKTGSYRVVIKPTASKAKAGYAPFKVKARASAG